MLSSLRRPLWAALPVTGAVLLSSCGGGGGDGTKVLNRAFDKPIDSADLKLQADIDVKGSPQLSQPLRFRASGPFRAHGNRLPSANLDVEAGVAGGQTISTGFVSTGDRLFVKFQDVYYEQPPAVVRRTNESFRRGRTRRTSLRALGLNPRSWLEEAKSQGDEQVAGVKTEHVSGKLNVANLVRDFNGFVSRSGGAIGSAAGQPAVRALTESQIRQIVDVVKDPNFDVYVGKRDGVLRRIAGRVQLQVPDRDRAQFGGAQGGTVRFSLEFDNVNGKQRIQAPTGARPLSELTQALGGGGTSPPTARPQGDAFKKYARCLDKAKPGDTDALQRCARLLR